MFEKSRMTKLLCDHLRIVNEHISYDRIAAITGRPVGDIRAAIASARRILERDKIVFAVVRGVGLRRINDNEIVQSTEQMKGTIRRASRRGLKRLEAISNVAALPPAEQMTAMLNRTIFEAVHQHAISPTTKSATAPAATPPVPDVKNLIS